MKSSPMTQMAECLCRLGPMPLNPGRYAPPSVRDLALEVLRAKRRPMTALPPADYERAIAVIARATGV